MVYSTCSILEEENEKIIEQFLQKNTNFEISIFDKKIKEKIKDEKFYEKYNKNDKYLQVDQNEKTDGFFMVKLARK